MTIAFNCSDCGTPLKVPDTFAGKKCKCPKCAVVNSVPTGAVEKSADDKAPLRPKKEATTTEPTKSKPTVAASVATEPAKTTKKAKPAVVEEADDELPEEEADGKPGKKGKRKKDKAKKGGSKMLVLLGGGAILLFFGCLGCGGIGGGAAWWFGWFSSTPDEFKYLPTGTASIHSQRVEQLRNSQVYKDIAAVNAGKNLEFDNFDKAFGLDVNNVEPQSDWQHPRGSGAESITVVRTKAKPSRLRRLLANSKARERQRGVHGNEGRQVHHE